MEERELYVPNTAREALEMLEEQFTDSISREALHGMWDYGVESGQQMVLDYLRGALNAEFINEEDESLLDRRDS